MRSPYMQPRAEDFPHRIIETLRFADTDRNGHITSSVFAICCQSGRLGLLSDPARQLTPLSSQFVLARLILDYRREMHWPGAVEIGTRIERIGRSSITLAQALFQNDCCVATAQSVAVLMDATSRRACPIPLASVQRLQPFTCTGPSAGAASALAVTHLNGLVHLLPSGQMVRPSNSRPTDDV
ncbi:MAG: acyl-CoA thioesterase [Hyphomicrobiaceae bacterium]